MQKVAFEPVCLRLVSVLAEIHSKCFGAECWSVDQIRGSLELETTKGWLAIVDDEPAGFILCQIMGKETEILTLCVLPSKQRQGIGKKLLNRVMGSLPLNNFIHLEVAADNLPARQLYEKFGFTEVNVRKSYYQRGTNIADAICYRYEITENFQDLQDEINVLGKN